MSNPAFPAGCSGSTAAVPAMPSDIGYVAIRAFSGNQAAAAEFARQVQQRIREQDSETIVGWIVDLRGNGGGNMWPMLAGIGPLLGEGMAGSFVYPVGTPTPWGYGRNGSYAGSTVQQSVTDPYTPLVPNPRVAVLTDKAVASSGEAIAVAFRARPSTRSFGTDTCVDFVSRDPITTNFKFDTDSHVTVVLSSI